MIIYLWPWFFVLRLKKARMGLLIKLIFSRVFITLDTKARLGLCLSFLGAFELSYNEYGFSI